MTDHSLKFKFVLAFTFFASAILGLFFVYKHTNDTALIAEQKLTEWRLEANRRDEIKSLDSMIKKIEKEKAELETHFAYGQNPVSFLNALENSAKSAGASASVSSVDVARDEDVLMVGFDVAGSFGSLNKFTMLLESFPYDLDIVSMDVHKEGGDEASPSSEWKGTFKIKLLTFVK